MNRIFGLRALARSYITWRRECDEQRAAAELAANEKQALSTVDLLGVHYAPYHLAAGG